MAPIGPTWLPMCRPHLLNAYPTSGIDRTPQSDAVYDRWVIARDTPEAVEMAREATAKLAEAIFAVVEPLPWIDTDGLREALVMGWIAGTRDTPTRPDQTNVHTVLALYRLKDVLMRKKMVVPGVDRPTVQDPEGWEKYRQSGWALHHAMYAGYELGREPETVRTDFPGLHQMLWRELTVLTRRRSLLDRMLGR